MIELPNNTRLTVIEEAPRTPYWTGKRYVCQCKCGRKTTAHLDDLLSGRVRSCGCMQKEQRAKQGRIYSKYFKVATVAVLLLCVTAQANDAPELTASESLSSIEVNAYHSDCDGRHVLTQLIFRDWYWQCECSHVIAWRLVNEKCPRPTRVWPSGDYETVWLDGDVMRRVRARTLDETVTLHDPELCERESLPQESRRGLRVR